MKLGFPANKCWPAASLFHRSAWPPTCIFRKPDCQGRGSWTESYWSIYRVSWFLIAYVYIYIHANITCSQSCWLNLNMRSFPRGETKGKSPVQFPFIKHKKMDLERQHGAALPFPPRIPASPRGFVEQTPVHTGLGQFCLNDLMLVLFQGKTRKAVYTVVVQRHSTSTRGCPNPSPAVPSPGFSASQTWLGATAPAPASGFDKRTAPPVGVSSNSPAHPRIFPETSARIAPQS